MSEELRAALEQISATVSGIRAGTMRLTEGLDEISRLSALRASTDAAADIVLVSQDRCGSGGYQIHGLFHSFADAARHVAKDAGLNLEQTAALVEAWNKAGDRHESAERREWWVASRQPIRPLYAHPPADAAVAGVGRYLIRKGGYYYRPNAQGYTTDKAQAGRYSLEDAIRHSHPNGPDGPRDGMSYEPAPALPHPAPAEPVGHWHGKDADDMLARFRKKDAEPAGLRSRDRIALAICNEQRKAHGLPPFNKLEDMEPHHYRDQLRWADAALSTLTRTDEAQS